MHDETPSRRDSRGYKTEVTAGLTVGVTAGLTVDVTAGLTVGVTAGLTVGITKNYSGRYRRRTSRGQVGSRGSGDLGALNEHI